MKKEKVSLSEIKLVGVTARTNNADEMNPKCAKIKPTMEKYFGQNLFSKIKHRKNPGITFCVYTDYESDFTGDYTYFIGEEVMRFDIIGEDFKNLTIPAQRYAKLTNSPGPMPKVVIEMWQDIWNMQPSDLGGLRSYIGDFEVYDERSHDPQNAIVDIYVGLKH